MRFYEASAEIDAPPDQVWPVLVDVGRYAEWDSGVLRVEGEVVLGGKLKLTSDVDPDRTFALKVTELVPGERLVLRGGAPLGLFTGTRTYRLESLPGERSEVHVREVFTGPLLPMIWRSMPDLQPSFDTFVSGLKAEAEGRYR